MRQKDTHKIGPASFQSPVHENGVCYSDILKCGRTSVYTEV